MTATRAWTATALLIATGFITSAARSQARAGAPPTISMPLTIGGWTGVDQPPLDAETERVLAADAYVDRDYSSPGHAHVGLYVAYYAQQRPGASIHSPLHCLPGTGWEPSEVATMAVTRPDGSTGTLRRMIVRKHLEQALVLYWYSIHGRMLANEFASKAWLIHDGIRLGRSDASLVRIVVPISPSTDSVTAAERDGLAFANELLRSSPSAS